MKPLSVKAAIVTFTQELADLRALIEALEPAHVALKTGEGMSADVELTRPTNVVGDELNVARVRANDLLAILTHLNCHPSAKII